MEITIKEEIKEIKEITVQEYNVHQINSISKKYPNLRQASKSPTFALTFGGTTYTLKKNCGFNDEEAQQVSDRYHELYTESDQWISDKLDDCCRDGYATVAFGLRVRTPVLAKSILNTNVTARISSSEARSVGNAISGQSYGLLNNRAAIAFMQKVWASDYKYDIFPACLIHDAIYLVIRDDLSVLKWVNDNLVEEMEWQELPEIAHDQVKLGAELALFHPDWSNEILLPNYISKVGLKEVINNSLSK